MSYVNNYTIGGTFSDGELIFTNRDGFTFSIELGVINGATGPVGATGPTGPTGPTGATGPAGVGITLVSKDQSVSRAGNTTGNQNWFNSPAGFTLSSSKRYRFRGFIKMAGQGTTSHAIRPGFDFSGSITSINWTANGLKNTNDGAAGALQSIHRTTTTATVNATLANVSNGGYVEVQGVISVNGGGTLTPIFAFSGAPGSTSFTAFSYFEIYEIFTAG